MKSTAILLLVTSLMCSIAQAQNTVRADSSLAGAGGAGGAGGGAPGRVNGPREIGVRNIVTPYATHVRSSSPPPMDPTRRVYEVDCTKPFDSLGKGNLRCM